MRDAAVRRGDAIEVTPELRLALGAIARRRAVTDALRAGVLLLLVGLALAAGQMTVIGMLFLAAAVVLTVATVVWRLYRDESDTVILRRFAPFKITESNVGRRGYTRWIDVDGARVGLNGVPTWNERWIEIQYGAVSHQLFAVFDLDGVPVFARPGYPTPRTRSHDASTMDGGS